MEVSRDVAVKQLLAPEGSQTLRRVGAPTLGAFGPKHLDLVHPLLHLERAQVPRWILDAGIGHAQLTSCSICLDHISWHGTCAEALPRGAPGSAVSQQRASGCPRACRRAHNTAAEKSLKLLSLLSLLSGCRPLLLSRPVRGWPQVCQTHVRGSWAVPACRTMSQQKLNLLCDYSHCTP